MDTNQTRTSPGSASKTSSTDPTDVVGDVKNLATKVAGQAKDMVADQVSGQQERSAGELDRVADAIRQTGDSLADTVAGPYVEKAAAMLERVSGSVRTANLRDTLRATERFARRDPVMFLGGAFLVGLLAGRFLKSSAQHDAPEQRLLPAGTPDGGPMMMGTDGMRGGDGGY